MTVENFFTHLPENPAEEEFTDLLKTPGVRIERIVSLGHTAPQAGWFDQAENEWVMVVSGEAKVKFESGEEHHLLPGSFVNIPRHCKHRVSWTHPTELTVWLAVFYP